MMKMEMLYAVFVRLNGNTDNARSGNAGFFLTPVLEIMVFNTKYILYNIMKYNLRKGNMVKYCNFSKDNTKNYEFGIVETVGKYGKLTVKNIGLSRQRYGNESYVLYAGVTKITQKNNPRFYKMALAQVEKCASARALKQANKVAKMMGF